MDNGNLNQDLIRFNVKPSEKDDLPQYGSIDKPKQDGGKDEEGDRPNLNLPMGEKERKVMLMVMGVVSFLGYTQFSMVGPFYPQYVSINRINYF